MKYPLRGADKPISKETTRPFGPSHFAPAPAPMAVRTAVSSLQSTHGGDRMIGEEAMSIQSETDHLRQQLLRAQRLSSVGTLASSVAHEFNNILTTIMNYAKLGLRPETSEAARREALEKILKGSQRAATVISSMLGFARNQSS